MAMARLSDPRRTAAGLADMLAKGDIPTDYAHGLPCIWVKDFKEFLTKLANTESRRPGNAAKYPFSGLMVGQSFTVPGGTAVAESVRAAARAQTERRGWHFRVERPDKETIRVTRVSTAEETVVANDDRLTKHPWKDTGVGERFFIPFKKNYLLSQAKCAIRNIVKARCKNRPAEKYEIDWTENGGWVRRVAAAAMLWLLGAGAANAQEPQQCGLWAEIKDGVEGSQYHEELTWFGATGDGQAVWVLFLNRATGSFTIVQRFPDKACIVAGGNTSDRPLHLPPGGPAI